MKLGQLRSALEAATLSSHTFSNSTGGTFVVTPHGGRVLGLFTHETGDNLFFTNPELVGPQAQAYLSGEHVLGGDRLWISPERGLFFKGDTLAEGVVTQPSIDPGNWVIARRSPTSIRLVNEFAATYFRIPGSVVRGTVERSIRLIESPFAFTPKLFPALQQVRFAGYEIASRFDLHASPSDTLYFGMWFLIQLVVPHGGYLYAPTSGKATITDYYEPTGADYLRVEETHVRFKLDSRQRHKIGIRKTEATGRVAFLSHEANGEATLIVRNFLNDPSSHYADVPLHTPAGTQDSVQSYNHFTGPGGFGELEFHTPGVNRAMPEPSVTDLNQVWAFTGPRAALVTVAAKLLALPESAFSVN